MKITFQNAALSIVIEEDGEYVDVVEVLEALKAYRVTNISHTPATPVVVEPPAQVVVTEPVAAATEAVDEFEEEGSDYSDSDVKAVYGAGFNFDDSSNPILGFRQPVVGDIYLDPNPGDGSNTPKPRRKTTPTEFGPRLILTHR